jgi:trehalose synthase
MHAQVAAGRSHLEAYAEVLGIDVIERLREKARPLRRTRVLHLSASASRTHHARTLAAVMPLLSELGLDVEWVVPRTDAGDEIFAETLYAAIEGDDTHPVADLADTWLAYAKRIGSGLSGRFDVVAVHDTQLLPLRTQLRHARSHYAKWVWHCHVDLRDCRSGLLDVIKAHLVGYSRLVPEHVAYLPEVKIGGAPVIPTVIDPLSRRNIRLGPTKVDAVLARFGVSRERPMVIQVSTFDGWDDPQWAICTHDLTRKLVPGVQTVLVATAAGEAGGEGPFQGLDPTILADPDLILVNSAQAGDIEINALQGSAAVAIQQRVRKAFAPGLLEASWKGRPVLAGDSGSLADQVVQGQTGYIFQSFEDAAERIAALIHDPALADSLGLAGHRLVRDNHLVTRWVEDYLDLIASVQRTAA